MLKAFSVLEEKIGEKYPNELKEKSVCDLLYGVLLMICKAGKSSDEIRTYIDSYETKYPRWWECKIIKHLGKSKRAFLLCARFRIICGLKGFTYLHSKMI
jgi:hypothetical protein